MSTHISLVIIDSDTKTQESIKVTLKPFSETITIAGSVDNFSDGARLIEKALPNVVILEVTDIMRGIQEVQFISSQFPQTSVIVSSAENSSEWILSLMRAGAVEYMLQVGS